MCPMVPAWGLLAFGLELAAAGAPPAWLAACHGALALATYAAWRGLGRPELAARRAGWLALAVPFVGAFAAWAVALGAVGAPPAEALEPKGTPRLGPQDLAPPPAPYRGLWELEPLLRGGDLETRLGAVRALKALEGPEGVAVLRGMLVDPDHQVVLLASLALAELEAEFETAIREARATGPGPALAGLLRRYAESGLVAEVLLPGVWREVATLAAAPRDRAAALLALGDPAGALTAAGEDPEAALVRLEALFALGDYGGLQAAAAAVAAPPGSPAALVAAYWSDPDA